MESAVCVVILLCMIGSCWCNACPDNSTILQDGGRSWCTWTIGIKLTLYDIVDTCVSAGWLLFSVQDQTVQDFLEGPLRQVLEQQEVTSEVWLNLNATSMETFEGMTHNYTNWDTTGVGTGECVTATYPGYLWTRTDCREQHFGMCYKEIDCPVSGRYLTNYGLCFWVTTTRESLNAGDLRCGQNGGSLAVFNNSDVMDAVTTNPVFSDFLVYGPIWIGINDMNGSYLTIDGSPVPYVRWNTGEPNRILEECVTVEWTLRMHDVYCTRSQVSLCFKWNTDTVAAPPPIISPTESVTTSKPANQSETTTSSNMSCSCLCVNISTITNSASGIKAKLLQLKLNTRIDFKNTTAYRRKLVCATDDRWSCKTMGVVAALVLFVVVAFPIVADTTKFSICAEKKSKKEERMHE